jgi:toxin ParE1/3/4
MELRYTERAKIEIDTAMAWYEQQQRGLGLEFLACIETSLKHIQYQPQMYEKLYVNFRRTVVNRFPFSIFYTIEGGTIIIHAVFDNRQNPEKRP